MTVAVASGIDDDGFTIVPEVLRPVETAVLGAALSQFTERAGAAGRGGARGLLRLVPEVRALASHPAVRAAAGPRLHPTTAAIATKAAALPARFTRMCTLTL